MKKWIGIVVYFGLFPSAVVSDYWSGDPQIPRHGVAAAMSLVRFEQIKRFFT
jgi:Transposase IS4